MTSKLKNNLRILLLALLYAMIFATAVGLNVTNYKNTGFIYNEF